MIRNENCEECGHLHISHNYGRSNCKVINCDCEQFKGGIDDLK